MIFGQTRVRLVQAGAVLAAAALVAGCGNNYHPTVTSSSPTGPASQPESYAVVVSAPSSSTAGVATVIDYSGDSILAQADIGVGPTAFTLDVSGTEGYTLNSNGTLTNFPVSSTLQSKQVTYSTLPSTAQPVNLFSPSSGLWAADLCGTNSATTDCVWDDNPELLNFSGADVFVADSSGTETWLKSIPLAPTPVMVVGYGGDTTRFFGISQGNSQGKGNNISSEMACNISPTTPGVNGAEVNGEADVIDVSSYTISNKISLGLCPVYAVESSDSKRLFVLNRGSDTVTVIKAQDGKLDSCDPFTDPNTGRTVTCHSSLPLSLNAGLAQDSSKHVSQVAGPVYAQYNTAKSLLVVVNYDGGTISVIDVSLDAYGNDSSTFGTTYTIPVGNNPASVTILHDGSRAYVANQTDQTVTVAELVGYTVEKTLTVTGHPRTVVSAQNSIYGKVYVASPDSNFLTIISTGGTDPDSVNPMQMNQGNIVDVRVTAEDGVSKNYNNVSRSPGYGQPCNLPLSEFDPASSTLPTASMLTNCKVQDSSSLVKQ
jgi:hypothetical protein